MEICAGRLYCSRSCMASPSPVSPGPNPADCPHSVLGVRAVAFLTVRNQQQTFCAVHLLQVLGLERKALIITVTPGLDAVGVMGAGRVAGLAAAVQADQGFVPAKIHNDAHGRYQPGIKTLTPVIRRNVQRAVIAPSRVGTPV